MGFLKQLRYGYRGAVRAQYVEEVPVEETPKEIQINRVMSYVTNAVYSSAAFIDVRSNSPVAESYIAQVQKIAILEEELRLTKLALEERKEKTWLREDLKMTNTAVGRKFRLDEE